MIKVAAFTGGQSVPSARFRVRQISPELRKEGIVLQEFVSAFGTYPPVSKLLRPGWAIANLATRIPDIIKSYQYDMCFLQREFLSTYRTLEMFTKKPRVLDVDDAIWLSRKNSFAGYLARDCEMVICGNSFLADYFRQWNKNIVIIPTPVDTKRFVPQPATVKPQRIVIGWTGSSANYNYLYSIEEALAQTISDNPHVTLRVIADCAPTFTKVPSSNVEYIPWSPEVEIQSIQSLTVGIMPMIDSDWARGKCSYKMLLYMACGIPVIVSPIGMNAEILSLGNIGLGAISISDWKDALLHLLSAPEQRAALGKEGHRVVHEKFSLDATIPLLAESLRHLVRTDTNE